MPLNVNVEMFALYIFSRYSRFSNIRENIYNLKFSYIMPHRTNIIKNANLSSREIANFCKFVKIYTREKVSTFTVLGNDFTRKYECNPNTIPELLDYPTIRSSYHYNVDVIFQYYNHTYLPHK